MRNSLLFSAALAALATGIATPVYAGDFDVTGQINAFSVDSTATFINADKFPNDVSGEFTGIQIGAEYLFGEDRGFFVGAEYGTTFGDGTTSAPVRNGNYLIHYTEMNGFSYYDAIAGYDFGRFDLYAGYGQLTRDVVSYQSCPEDWNAVVAGFCRGGGVLPNNEGREGLRGGEPQEDTADLTILGARYEISDRWSIDLRYMEADFEQSISPLDVIANAENTAAGNRIAHGPTSFAQDFQALSVGLQIRF